MIVGRRLVYTPGVVTLVVLAGLLLILFGGVTDRLIPLFAVGAFLAFTVSQAGMVQHWRRTESEGARLSMFVNAFGALATGLTVCIIVVAKFTEGAWITVLLIPALMILMTSIRHHYDRIRRETEKHSPLNLQGLRAPLVVVPMEHWSRVAEKALRFAYTLSSDVHAVHIEPGNTTVDMHGLTQVWGRVREKRGGASGTSTAQVSGPEFPLSVRHLTDP